MAKHQVFVLYTIKKSVWKLAEGGYYSGAVIMLQLWFFGEVFLHCATQDWHGGKFHDRGLTDTIFFAMNQYDVLFETD